MSDGLTDARHGQLGAPADGIETAAGWRRCSFREGRRPEPGAVYAQDDSPDTPLLVVLSVHGSAMRFAAVDRWGWAVVCGPGGDLWSTDWWARAPYSRVYDGCEREVPDVG